MSEREEEAKAAPGGEPETGRAPEVMRIAIRADGLAASRWLIYDLDTGRVLPVTRLTVDVSAGEGIVANVGLVVSKIVYEGEARVEFAEGDK